jgi:hypothetical protein
MTSAPGPAGLVWRKSSRSNGDGGACVEVALGVPGVVPVRDSKVRGGAVLCVADAGWAVFVRAVKDDSLHRS